MSLATLLNDSVTVQRKSPTRDTSGGQVEAFAAVAALSNLQAAVQPYRGEARRSIGQRQVFVTHHVYLLTDGVLRGDKLVNDATGDSYLVLGFFDEGGKGRLWRAECSLET